MMNKKYTMCELLNIKEVLNDAEMTILRKITRCKK